HDPPSDGPTIFARPGSTAGRPAWEEALARSDVIRLRVSPADGTCSPHFDDPDLARVWRGASTRGPGCGSGGGWLQLDLLSRGFLPAGGADRGEQRQEGGDGGDANADPEGQDGAVGLGESYRGVVRNGGGGVAQSDGGEHGQADGATDLLSRRL